MTDRICRCEATIAPALLDGYACGSPECWRTAETEAAFARFVAELVRRREATTERSSDDDRRV